QTRVATIVFFWPPGRVAGNSLSRRDERQLSPTGVGVLPPFRHQPRSTLAVLAAKESSMFQRLRKVLLAGAAALAFLVPLGGLSEAKANSGSTRGHRHHFAVYYRSNCDSPWYSYGNCRSRHVANQVAQYLQSYGYETFVR